MLATVPFSEVPTQLYVPQAAGCTVLACVSVQVQANLEKRLPELQAAADKLKAEHEVARQRSKWCV